MKNKIFIFVDDDRINMFKKIAFYASNAGIDCYWCKTYKSAIDRIKFHTDVGDSIVVDLDHDLGEKKTGYDVAKWIVENNIPLYGFNCHSFNPVGRKNIEELLSHYGYERKAYEFWGVLQW